MLRDHHYKIRGYDLAGDETSSQYETADFLAEVRGRRTIHMHGLIM